jgi:hypothetical protein
MLRTEGTFFARTEHGGHRVVADNKGFLVSWPNEEVRYPSARQTLIALTNQAPRPLSVHRDPKITFNRYFRLGKYSVSRPPVDALTMFSPKVSVAVPTVVIKSSPALSVEARPKGIDLAKRGHEVRKLFYAGYGRRVTKYGYDPEDVLQDVFTGILVRNHGKCPFDPSKSSFGHYVHMVCGCIVSNYRRRYSRLERNEQYGVLAPDSEEVLDVRDADLAVVDPNQHNIAETKSLQSDLYALVMTEAPRHGVDPETAVACYDLMATGHRKGEIVSVTQKLPAQVAKAMKAIRQIAAEWRSAVGF